MTDRRCIAALWALALLSSLCIFGASLLLGDLNQDEGWYLYAGRMVREGRLPYVDFASTQGPVVSFAYALAQPLVDRWGLVGGRIFTAVLGLAGCLLGSGLAARLATRGIRCRAALFAFMLVGLNLYQCHFTTMVKTYALTSVLLGAGFLALAFAGPRGGYAAAAGVLMGLAAGSRTSAAAVLPVVFLGLAWQAWKRRLACAGDRRLLFFTAGAAGAVAAVFLPFLVRAPQAFWFGLVEYHSSRASGGLGAVLAYKAGFISRVTQSYFLPIGLLAVLCVRRWSGRERSAMGGENALTPVILWGSVAAVTLLHLAAPFPYDDYQAIIFPLMAAGLGAWLAQAAEGGAGNPAAWRGAAVSLLLLSLAAAGSSPTLQGWFVGARDRIWWPLRKEAPLATFRKTAALLRERTHAKRGDLLLTQDTYLAVETGMSVPAGLELGPFSYFPEWSRAKAEACHVLNREMLLELLATCPATVAAFSGYGLAIRSPEIAEVPAAERDRLWGVILSRYRPLFDVPRFGQADTTLRVLLRGDVPGTESGGAGGGKDFTVTPALGINEGS